jgi:asparagine synthase (glutamine-hydrolysing)
MCGIAGVLSLNQNLINQDRLKSMTEALIHRGPDGDGYWINPNNQVGFGHRRLSIIDLTAAAAQPMHYLGRYTIVYNGEIYNYIELRSELQKLGYRFVSQSDTEVILAAFDHWKYDCLSFFDGMFSLAIWDEKEQTLFAARDRFGEKPFYYFQDEEAFVFASEMKALWAAGVKKEPSYKMLLNYLILGHLQNPTSKDETFFEHILSIPPGHFFTFNIQTTKFKIHKYWDLDKNKEVKISADEVISTFSSKLSSSVSMRLRSDVAVGTSLSGGLDSSSIAAIIKRDNTLSAPLKTFSAVFPGFEKDESKHIQSVIDNFDIENYQVTPTAENLISDFERLCYHQEEPFSSSSIFAQYKVYELAKQNKTKVLLDGQGADETLAGYDKYIHWHLQQLLNRGSKAVLKKEIKILEEKKIPFEWGIKNYLAALFPSHAAILLEKMESTRSFSHPHINKDFIRSLSGKDQQAITKPIVTKLNDILYFNVMQLGLEELLRFADRNSMAHGTEVRLPFLQHQLVEFIFSLPAGYKIHEGWTKWVLRKSMEKTLPENIVWRTDKIGYEPPQFSWMQNKTIQEYIHSAKEKLVKEGILKKDTLEKTSVPKSAHAADNFDWRYLSAAQIL